MVRCRRPPAPGAYSPGNNPAARRVCIRQVDRATLRTGWIPTSSSASKPSCCRISTPRTRRADTLATEFNEELHSESAAEEHPEAALLRTAARESLREALDRLPPEFREVIVLRELEGLSYKEISDVAGVPVGTVMSRLSRARKRLQDALCAEQQER